MPDDEDAPERLSRRRFLEISALAAAVGAAAGGCKDGSTPTDPPEAGSTPPAPAARTARSTDDRRLNILLILTDQERYFESRPFAAPGREWLERLGVRFDNHQIASNVCSPSRSVIYTGRHIQKTGVFDNVNAPWQDSMSTEIPTVGTLLGEAGYHAAYKGKFHLSVDMEVELDREGPIELLTHVLEQYGFSDYYGVGDTIAATHGGYQHDELITAETVRWLRGRGRQLDDDGSPWFLAVNLINPHDVMYVDTDEPGELVQGASSPVMGIAPPPDTRTYRESWDVPLPKTRHQAFDEPGRPAAHGHFQRGRAVMLGTWPDEDRRWKVLQDYYFNCIRDSDRHIERILAELEDQDMLDRTVIVLTSDHGELGGAHQMHGKGPCAYREQNHVPLVIAHPGHDGGKRCAALTSHVDITPTLLDLAGANRGALVGKSLVTLLDEPEGADPHAIRKGALFAFNMLSYLDAAFLEQLKAARDARRLAKVRKGARVAVAARPALEQRGAIRSVFDGRYRFSRYFSPREHNTPDSYEALTGLNDLELFDLENDPTETANLATDPDHRPLLLRMNDLLNELVRDEVGLDDGSFVPLARLADWDLETADI